MAHESVTVETSDAGALVSALGVLAVGVHVAVVLGHLALVLIYEGGTAEIKLQYS